MRAVVFLAGPLKPTAQLRAALEDADLVVAADGGIRHAMMLGRTPNLWVGDFDSTPEPLLERYRHLPREHHPRDKDATDGELAVQAGLRAGARELLLAGALGGEPDHALAHAFLALRLTREGRPSFLTDGTVWAWPLVPPGLSLRLPPGSRFSLVPLTDLKGVTLTGARWPLEDASIPLGATRTLRNESKGQVIIRLSQGAAMLYAWPASSGFSAWCSSSPDATNSKTS